MLYLRDGALARVLHEALYPDMSISLSSAHYWLKRLTLDDATLGTWCTMFRNLPQAIKRRVENYDR